MPVYNAAGRLVLDRDALIPDAGALSAGGGPLVVQRWRRLALTGTPAWDPNSQLASSTQQADGSWRVALNGTPGALASFINPLAGVGWSAPARDVFDGACLLEDKRTWSMLLFEGGTPFGLADDVWIACGFVNDPAGGAGTDGVYAACLYTGGATRFARAGVFVNGADVTTTDAAGDATHVHTAGECTNFLNFTIRRGAVGVTAAGAIVAGGAASADNPGISNLNVGTAHFFVAVGKSANTGAATGDLIGAGIVGIKCDTGYLL
ncbi:MAG: hypothetical protein ABIJ75_10260 [Actinomycetota bacterium]